METIGATTANEPIAACGTNSYTDVMMMLYSMPITPEVKRHVSRRLALEVDGKYLEQAIERVNHLARLRNGWDGYGASRILPEVVSNMREVLLISDDTDWKYWLIGPESNGTLGIQSSKHRASISLGRTEFSYYALIDGKRLGESHIDFTPEAFYQTMKMLNK